MNSFTRRLFLTGTLAAGSGLALTRHGFAVETNIGQTPHLARTATNILSNPTMNGTEGWSLIGEAAYVTDQRRNGQGSIKVRAHHKDSIVSKTYRVLPAGSKNPGPTDLVEGQVYTYSFYMKSLDGPKFVFSQIGSSVNGAFGRNFAGAWYGSTHDGVWEECAVVFQIPTGEGITGITVQAGANEGTRPDSVAYVTDFYLGEGFQFADAPTPKRPFNGKHVQIDELGNWTIRGKQLFPIFLYTNLNLSDRTYSFYIEHGDASIWENSINGIKNAWSGGLHSLINLSHYTMPNHSWGLSGNTTHLQTLIRDIDKQGLSEAVIGYYLDNELHNAAFHEQVRVLKSIREVDTERPIYILQGAYGIARTYAAAGVQDVTGTYAGGSVVATGGFHGDLNGLSVLEHLAGQTSPVSVAQFNNARSSADFRNRLYNAILAGAKAIGMYADGLDNPPFEEWESFGELPEIRKDLAQLLPVIRKPHWAFTAQDIKLIADRVRPN